MEVTIWRSKWLKANSSFASCSWIVQQEQQHPTQRLSNARHLTLQKITDHCTHSTTRNKHFRIQNTCKDFKWKVKSRLPNTYSFILATTTTHINCQYQKYNIINLQCQRDSTALNYKNCKPHGLQSWSSSPHLCYNTLAYVTHAFSSMFYKFVSTICVQMSNCSEFLFWQVQLV